jgi:hypothetical protein
MDRHRGRSAALALALTLAVALCCAAGALGAKPTVVRAGNLVARLNGGVSPKALPKHRLSPISLSMSADLATTDGSQPPPAQTVTIDFDKHGTINARGLATCRQGQLEAQTTRNAKKVCGKALVGTGKTSVQVQFAESQPFGSSGPLLLFNGGTRRGVTTMYIHAYVHVPVATALVTVVKIHRIHKGPYGTRAIATIPRIANGAGSLMHFNISIHRNFRHHGRRESYLLARCANAHFRAKATLVTKGGPKLSGSVVRPCRPKG